MLYMVELHYTSEHRDAALRYFLDHGATHYEGKVALQQVWVATHDHIAYALVSSESDSEVEKACRPLNEFGEAQFRHVTSGDEI